MFSPQVLEELCTAPKGDIKKLHFAFLFLHLRLHAIECVDSFSDLIFPLSIAYTLAS